ncbi:MAG: hypothetical protein N5P05_003758 [Chroococcopsis gigantea SAG 12.99]|nr:biotin transporter BioY [Chlorogloea purpurea SAG 13.99]MDV3002152.1 hypothetical protein [Chroococcopsis gigantea SAG 12.99]
MSTNRDRKRQTYPNQRSKVSVPSELIWSLIGLLLTIFSTFVSASIINPPWSWANSGIASHDLGVTYQIGAVLLTGCLGGKNAGLLAQVAYIFLGLTWLPVFAKGGGWEYLQEPGFGYILGFMPGAWVCGWLAFKTRMKLETLALSAVSGLLIIHLCGLLYLLALCFINWQHSSKGFLTELSNSVMNYSIIPFPGQLVVVFTIVIIAFSFRKLLFY